jgi:hypothetical protein
MTNDPDIRAAKSMAPPAGQTALFNAFGCPGVRAVRWANGADGQLLHMPRLRDEYRLLVVGCNRSDVGHLSSRMSARFALSRP